MDILHIQHPFVPDQGYQENYLPRKQAELGHEVTMVTTDVLPKKFRGQADQSEFRPGEYEYDGVNVRRLPSVSIHDAATYSRGVARAIRELNPDIVHSHRLISLHTLQSLVGSRRSSTRLFFDAHIDNDNFHLDSIVKSVGFGLYNRTVIPAARQNSDAIIAVNPYCERFLRERCGIPAEEIRLLPLGADTDKFYTSASERRATRDELGYDDDEVVYMFAGNVSPTKDIENLVRAFATVDSEEKQLLILGEGPDDYMERLRTLVDGLGLTSRVTFHNFVPHSDLYRYYNAGDVGVWPGKLGITIIEGIACGLPVILPKSPATEFLIDKNGLSYRRGDVDELSDCMSRYAHDEDIRTSAAIASERLVQERLSWDRIARRSIEIYRGG
jgi:glycosyltransferase involved in cell wall biosynthesis